MKIVKTITTKGKRFTITEHDGCPGKYNTWKANYELEMKNILSEYVDKGYTEVSNGNGGDDDFLCFDHLKKQYIWCENGFYPFYKSDLEEYEYNKNVDLSYLYSIRN